MSVSQVVSRVVCGQCGCARNASEVVVLNPLYMGFTGSVICEMCWKVLGRRMGWKLNEVLDADLRAYVEELRTWVVADKAAPDDDIIEVVRDIADEIETRFLGVIPQKRG